MRYIKVQSGIEGGPTIEVRTVEFETPAEAIATDGEDQVRDGYNAHRKQGATQTPKGALRDAWAKCGQDPDSEVWLEAVEAYREAVENYTPKGKRGGSRPGGITAKEEQAKMRRLAEIDPDRYAEIMGSIDL